MGFVCSLVLISLGFQSSQPSHPPVPNRCVNTLFRILKDNKEYKRTRKDHFSFHGRVTGGLREGWWKILEDFFGALCMIIYLNRTTRATRVTNNGIICMKCSVRVTRNALICTTRAARVTNNGIICKKCSVHDTRNALICTTRAT